MGSPVRVGSGISGERGRAVRRGFLSATALVAGLVLLVMVDALRLDSSFIQVVNFQDYFGAPGPNLQAMLTRQRDDPRPYRLLDFKDSAQNDQPAVYGIDLVAGHHPNDLVRYRELIGMTGSGMPHNLGYSNISKLLNVRYILWPNYQLGPAPASFPVVAGTRVASGQTYETLLSTPALDRARLVTRAVVKPDGEDVQYMISDTTFDPATEVVLPQAPPIALDGGPVQGGVTWEERTPNMLRLHVTADRPALLVIADNWFPAWHATVDGAAAPVLRAYHTLRAVPVQAGDHTVEMTYHSDVVARSLWVTVLALLVLLGLGGWGLARERRRTP